MYAKFKIFLIIVFLAACTNVTPIPDISTNPPMPTVISSITKTPDGANQYSEIGDGGFITGNPCGPPCFFEIELGNTIAEATRSIEKYVDIFKMCKVYDDDPSDSSSRVSCQFIDIGYTQENVDSISFYPSQIFTLQDAINCYGQPDMIFVWEANLGDEPKKLGVHIFFDKIQTVLSLREQNGDIVTLNGKTPIWLVNYMIKSDYETFRNFEEVKPWNGFGDYQSTNVK